MNEIQNITLTLSSLRILEGFNVSGEYFDMQDLLKRYTMDSISKIAFGVDFSSLSNPRSEFSVAFDRMQELIVDRGRTPFSLFRFKKMFGIGIEGEVAKCASVLDGLVQHLIQERQKVTIFPFILFFFCECNTFPSHTLSLFLSSSPSPF